MQIAPTLILALMLLGPILGANAATVDPSDAAGWLKRAAEARPSGGAGQRYDLIGRLATRGSDASGDD